MNDKHDDNPDARGSDPLASLIRKAGRMPEPSAAFKQALRQELSFAWRRQVRERRQRRRWIGASLAAMLALVVIGLQFLEPGPQAAGTVLRASEGLRLSRADESRRTLHVGDVIPAGDRVMTGERPAALEIGAGVNVRLDADTHVIVTSGSHLVLETGRLYVDSGATLDGLVIDTPFGAVRDVGTQFTVALGPGQLTVQVRDGLVKLEQASSVIAVAPGQRLQLDEGGEMRTERIAFSGDAWSWVEAVAPVLVAEGRSLHAFLEAVHRQTGLEVRYATAEVAREAARTMIGGRHPDLPPRQLLDVVMSATNFRHVMTESAIVIAGN